VRHDSLVPAKDIRQDGRCEDKHALHQGKQARGPLPVGSHGAPHLANRAGRCGIPEGKVDDPSVCAVRAEIRRGALRSPQKSLLFFEATAPDPEAEVHGDDPPHRAAGELRVGIPCVEPRIEATGIELHLQRERVGTEAGSTGVVEVSQDVVDLAQDGDKGKRNRRQRRDERASMNAGVDLGQQSVNRGQQLDPALSKPGQRRLSRRS
jgi:hypothetical protein